VEVLIGRILARTGGPVTIAWHLERKGLPVPSTSAIRRVLHAAGLVAPEPRKRPRSSWIRFEAAEPNELWQSDFTHWRLADGSEVEIIDWLDDHARFLLDVTAFRRVSGDDVVATFTAAGEEHGWPAATLTDNGAVYTSRFTGGRNGFEYLLARLGIRRKNGSPGHPQTQGKIERFHQTLKRWLGQHPAAAHPAGRGTPGHVRLRYDVTDSKSAITLRRAGRLHHLKIGAVHARRRVLAIIDEQEVTVVALDTGEILSAHRIEPEKGYWRNQRRDPGRWPGSRRTG
jgi:hypothetical protein